MQSRAATLLGVVVVSRTIAMTASSTTALRCCRRGRTLDDGMLVDLVEETAALVSVVFRIIIVVWALI